jgi:hypothetical protein
MIIQPLAAQAAAATGAGTATNMSSARVVQCYQSGTTARLITVQDNSTGSDVVVGTLTLPAAVGSVLYIRKDPAYEIFAAHAEVFFTPVKVTSQNTGT